jgi:hypothetical protein
VCVSVYVYICSLSSIHIYTSLDLCIRRVALLCVAGCVDSSKACNDPSKACNDSSKACHTPRHLLSPITASCESLSLSPSPSPSLSLSLSLSVCVCDSHIYIHTQLIKIEMSGYKCGQGQHMRGFHRVAALQLDICLFLSFSFSLSLSLFLSRSVCAQKPSASYVTASM